MRLIVAHVLIFCLVQTSATITPATIKLLIWTAEYALKHIGRVNLVENKNTTFSNSLAKGFLGCNKLSIYGLNNLDVDLKKIEATVDSKGVTVNLNITFTKNVGINILDYEADMGIANSIPIYGKGNITAYTKHLDAYLHVNLLLNNDNSITLNEFTLKPVFGFVKISPTGVFNNSELNWGLTAILTLVADVIVLFWDNNVDCCSCAVSAIIKAILDNQFNIESIWRTLQTDCQVSCDGSNNEYVVKMFQSQNPTEFVRELTSPTNMAKLEEYLKRFIKF